MEVTFFKYHGNGNDFILFDNREGLLNFSKDQIKQLCHRRFGIGSDGIILIETHAGLDYHMNFYNPDGSQSFCGNGSRCALQFANRLGIVNKEASFLAIDGIHEAKIENENMCIHMLDVNSIERGENYIYLNTGSPHYVVFVENLDELNVFEEGQKIRYNERFKEVGTNVNFVEIKNGIIRSRVYERGVENETFSSGTGTTAQAIASYVMHREIGQNILIDTKGGQINVSFDATTDGTFSNIWLKGPVNHSFSGKTSI